MRDSKWKNFISLLLTLVLLTGVMPFYAFADGADVLPADENEISPSEPVAIDGVETVSLAFDLSLKREGVGLNAEGQFHVSVETGIVEETLIPEGMRKTGEQILLYHIHEDTWDMIEDAEIDETGLLTFTTRNFSTFLLHYTVTYRQIVKEYLTADGDTYLITVAYDDAAGIPDDADLIVKEILSDEDASVETSEYETYFERTKEALSCMDEDLIFARFFDISIEKDGVIIQPADGSTVSVDVRLIDTESSSIQVVHFGEQPEIITPEKTGKVITFETTGFSVYAIVDAPGDPYVPAGSHVAESLDIIDDEDDIGKNGFYLSYNKFYLTGGTVPGVSGNSDRTGLSATTYQYNSVPEEAVKFYFDRDESGNFYIYTKDDQEQRQYVKMTTVSGNAARAGLDFAVNRNDATAFTLEKDANNSKFRVSAMVGGTTYYWNRNTNGAGSGAFVGYNNGNDKNTAWIELHYETEPVKDPYDLDGKTYGIAYHNDSATSAALTEDAKTVNNQSRLAGMDMIMRPDVLDNEGILLVAEGADITEWTFESISEDKYYIKTVIDGATKYLTINGDNVTLADVPDETYSVIKATPGTGANSGKWHFSVNNRSLNFSGSAANGFNAATGNGASTWMNLVEKSVLKDEDFTLYTAKKVSVSDTVNVYDGQLVIIYTRIWNDTKKKYEFYAVDHDGSLIPCYDTGDNIEWIGSKVNTALWEFTEGHNPNGSLSYFYWLKDHQYGKYLVPQATNGEVISDSTDPFATSVNLNGRRYGENFTTIISWDDKNYSFSGLMTENGHAIPGALAEAEDFYFAIVQEEGVVEPPTTANTIDSTAYGITLKMINFNNRKTGTVDSPRDSVQNPFFGGDNNNAGLLSTDLSDGYPTTTSLTGNAGRSLSNLFSVNSGLSDVNHLFIESIYNESGYFEYDSTQNFAHLNEDGTFTVYDQLGAIGDYGTVTGSHGQFMPYNDLVDAQGYCSFTNQTSVTAQELSDLDARKGEQLYNIGRRRDVDYHFGMEMEAGFTQTASGLDAWGHDIIFEFSGDDDFWFYVDGELVLDLGGVHSAMTGSINFRTGEVKSSRGNSTLYEIFKKNYQTRDLSDNEIATKLSEIFKQNENGQYVFKDYSNHTMRMFYMERGAGASNLHMRFNLAAVKPGSFILSKKLSGTDHPENDLIEFPYQIYYYSRDDGETTPRLLGENEGEAEQVFYSGKSTNVKYASEFKPSGGETAYKHVFFLKPGESAEVNMPDNVQRYYVVECGVNPSVYDRVYANDDLITGVPSSGNPGRNDYRTTTDTLENRSKVDFVNHVAEGAMRTLNITKKLYDADGVTVLNYPENPTLFTFRLYLGNEYAAADSLPAADLYSYYVKDPDGNYCRWDAGQQKFVSLGITDYSALSAYLAPLSSAEKENIIFVTSMNGSISKIPAGYTVEVRDLIVGTHWKVEERDGDIPKGYTLRLQDGYTRTDTDPVQNTGTTPISGTMQVNETPEVLVSNQKGWGLTIEKVWTDKDFMQTHDRIYFAVYVRSGTEDNPVYTLLDDSVRALETSEDSIYYFFDNLQSGVPFSNYEVYEVTLTGENIEITDGKVTGYETVTRIDENGTLTIGGTPAGGEHTDGFVYTVNYTRGEQTTQNENIRTDSVTNSRPGIKLYKTDWAGTKLAGAKFKLVDRDGNNVAAESYTSRESDGLITIAYLNPGTYTLTETETPNRYVGLGAPINITVDDDGGITVSAKDDDGTDLSEFFTYKPATETEMATITIKNMTVGLQVKKIDAVTKQPIKDVHFSLYRQVTDSEGKLVKDYLPISGYEDLVSDADGIIPRVNMENLSAGTYYLTENAPAQGYQAIPGDLCFTIGSDGTVTINTEDYESWVKLHKNKQAIEGNASYLIEILNTKYQKISIIKTDANKQTPIANARFALYKQVDTIQKLVYDLLTSDASGYLTFVPTSPTEPSQTVFELTNGTYVLTEIQPFPSGYYPLKEPVLISIENGTGDSYVVKYKQNEKGTEYITVQPTEGIYIIEVVNIPGIELPKTGGTGATPFYAGGGALALGAAGLMLMRRKKKKA